MATRSKTKSPLWVVATCLPLTVGCSGYLGFSTATKFGLDISQRADQTVEVSLGYDRIEIASVPMEEPGAENVASVFGSFCARYGNPWLDKPLRIQQVFATGSAAKRAADEWRRMAAPAGQDSNERSSFQALLEGSTSCD